MADDPNPVDVEVGRRLKQRRTLRGMSQERLGELLGVTYQQVQKYERGANRIGSSRLYDICRVLDVPVSYFFDEPRAAAPAAVQPTPPVFGLADAPAAFAYDAPAAPPALASEPAPTPVGTIDRETEEMMRAFRRIRDPLVRRRLCDLAQALAEPAHPFGQGP